MMVTRNKKVAGRCTGMGHCWAGFKMDLFSDQCKQNDDMNNKAD